MDTVNSKVKCLTTVAAAAAIGGLYFLFKRKKGENIPNKWKEVGTVDNIIIYPLKSGKRIELPKAQCTDFCLTETKEENENVFRLSDRCFIVYTEKEREFRTARNYPNLMLMSVEVHDKDHIKLSFPEKEPVFMKIPLVEKSKKIAVKFHAEERVYTIDCGDEVAQWISSCLQKPGLRLGYNDGTFRRNIEKVYKPMISYYKKLSNRSTGLYSDLSHVLLVNQKSVDDLNRQIENDSNITVHNFRPNIIVNGEELQPYVEDDWDWIKIGESVFRNVKECTRCVMTTVNPETGVRSMDREPIVTLQKYRMTEGPEKAPIMGINLEIHSKGFINRGDKVFIGSD